MERIIALLLLLAAAFPGSAQEVPTPERLDTLTYLHYIAGEWEEIVALKADANALEYDHYVWRIRSGTAHYYTENYHQSVRDFERALEFWPESEEALAWLYFAYKGAGRFGDALLLKRDHELVLTPDSIPDGSRVYTINAEGGAKMSTLDSIGTMRWTAAGASHPLGKTTYLYHGLANLQQDFYWGGLSQYQYYLRMFVPIDMGWVMEPSMHIVYVAPEEFDNYTDVHANLQFTRSLYQWKIGGGFGFGSYNGTDQVQLNGTGAWYPLGSYRLEVAAEGLLTVNSDSSQASIAPRATWWPGTWWYVGARGRIGELTNFTSDRAYAVNNSIYATRSQWGLNAGFIVKQQHEVYLMYNESTKYEHFLDQEFTYRSIVAGLKIRL